MERAEQAVFDFKEKGKDALASAVKGMHLTQGLQKLQSSLHTVMLSMDQKIDRLGSMAEELHVAKGHLKNAFLKMNGKDTAKITERNPEQGIIFKPRRCYSNPCGASISWNKKQSDCSSRSGSWKRDKENRHL